MAADADWKGRKAKKESKLKGKGGVKEDKGASDEDDEDDGDEDDSKKIAEEDLYRPLGDLPLYFLHGGMSQKERTEVFLTFCSATRGVLFCTDVASRGLHLPKVKWIVQCTAPASPAEYVHRVGRTARLDSAGKVRFPLGFGMESWVAGFVLLVHAVLVLSHTCRLAGVECLPCV
jgi:ERCC4-related helicase